MFIIFFFFQAEDGIRDLVRSRGLGDVYKRQDQHDLVNLHGFHRNIEIAPAPTHPRSAGREIRELSLIHI